MDIFLRTAIPFPCTHTLPKTSTTISKSIKAPAAVCCLGKNEGNGLSSGSFQTELEGHENSKSSEEMLQSVESVLKKKHNDIWQLFSEAQRNIMFLYKQRTAAMDELEKMKMENKFLIDRVEQLQMKKPSSGKDTVNIKSELLLRIDSMVLTGMIDTGEASDLRTSILDSKVSVADDFSDIHHKRDAKLLAELRHVSNENKKKCFHVVHICTEMEPVISVGSLASYVTGISRALQRKGHLVEVVLPK